MRESYSRGGQRILVVSDRLSAFDVVLGTIPFKGQVLNQLAAYWFEETRPLAPNHLIDVPDPNVTRAVQCRPLPHHGREGPVEVVGIPHLDPLELHAEARRRGLRLAPELRLEGQARGIPQGRDPRDPGRDLHEELERPADRLPGHRGGAGDVPAGPREALDEPGADGIVHAHHDDGRRSERLLGGEGGLRPHGDHEVRVQADQLRRQLGQPVVASVRPLEVDGDVAILDEAELAEAAPERLADRRRLGDREEAHAEDRRRRLGAGDRRDGEPDAEPDREEEPPRRHRARRRAVRRLARARGFR